MSETVQATATSSVPTVNSGTAAQVPLNSVQGVVPIQGILTGLNLTNFKTSVVGQTVSLSFDIPKDLADKLAALVPVVNLLLKVV